MERYLWQYTWDFNKVSYDGDDGDGDDYNDDDDYDDDDDDTTRIIIPIKATNKNDDNGGYDTFVVVMKLKNIMTKAMKTMTTVNWHSCYPQAFDGTVLI